MNLLLYWGSSGNKKCPLGIVLNLTDEYFKHEDSCNLQLKLSISIFNSLSRCDSLFESNVKSIRCASFDVINKLKPFKKKNYKLSSYYKKS